MKFAIAAALIAGASAASYPAYSAAANVTYTTKVVTAYETYCPGPTQITYGTNTYTVTEATTLTITDCPCTVSVPVYTTSSVACSTCSAASSSTYVPVYPTLSVPSGPVYPSANTTAVVPATTPEVPATGGVYPSTTPSSTPIPTGGAGKVATLSGAALAGLMGLVAFAL
ncbi:hypothetical protein GGR58DRAFT_353466 [Xylaria digitata]|uniref:Mmc protein n=1 Tax=Xylaria multiplex TaxID=323545 RepID=A0A7C8IQL3_9PEZI|nr:hypothetical protein GQX73_g5826 [Xylaria multiplex]KAI0537246.1 hypothetical protein GGR58DRAFT_353466 [Xylaria digitata]